MHGIPLVNEDVCQCGVSFSNMVGVQDVKINKWSVSAVTFLNLYIPWFLAMGQDCHNTDMRHVHPHAIYLLSLHQLCFKRRNLMCQPVPQRFSPLLLTRHMAVLITIVYATSVYICNLVAAVLHVHHLICSILWFLSSFRTFHVFVANLC